MGGPNLTVRPKKTTIIAVSVKHICPISDGVMKYIVGSRGASQLGGYLLGNPPGYKANKL